MSSLFEITIIIIVLIDWGIYIIYIVPKLKQYRKVVFWEYVISGPWVIHNLLEYRNICRKERTSLVWFKVNVFLLILFGFVLFLWTLS